MTTSILAVTNQKGGVGKTTTAVTLAVCYSTQGKKVLLADMNWQAHASNMFKTDDGTSFKIKAKLESRTVTEGLLSETITIEDLIFKTESENLDVLCTDKRIKTQIARKESASTGSQFMFKRLLKRSKIKEYDYIIIDTPPDIDLIFQNIMYASNYYLVPMTAEPDPFDGIDDLLEEIKSIKRDNTQLTCLGIIITNFFPEKIRTHKIMQPLIKKYADQIGLTYRGVINFSSTIASSSLSQTPLPWRVDLNEKSKKALRDYYKLAESLMPELRGPRRGNPQETPMVRNMPRELINPRVSLS